VIEVKSLIKNTCNCGRIRTSRMYVGDSVPFLFGSYSRLQYLICTVLLRTIKNESEEDEMGGTCRTRETFEITHAMP
jgi:hypothetical protein